MPFDATDVAMFVDPDMPGYVLATVGGIELGALFRNKYVDAFDVSGSAPVLRIVAADAPSVAQGDDVVIGATSYTVAGVEADGIGMVRLVLRESA